jgi:hypothetical protein
MHRELSATIVGGLYFRKHAKVMIGLMSSTEVNYFAIIEGNRSCNVKPWYFVPTSECDKARAENIPYWRQYFKTNYFPEIRADTQITTHYGGNERISVISQLEIIRGEMTVILIGVSRSKKYNIEI